MVTRTRSIDHREYRLTTILLKFHRIRINYRFRSVLFPVGGQRDYILYTNIRYGV